MKIGLSWFRKFRKSVIHGLLLLCGVALQGSASSADNSLLDARVRDRAQSLYFLTTARPLTPSDPMGVRFFELVKGGDERAAVALAMTHSGFINDRVRSLAALYLSSGKSARASLSDAHALFIGIARDNLDARELLTADVSYGAAPRTGAPRPAPDNDRDLLRIDQSRLDLSKVTVLSRYEPQWDLREFREAAGVLTSRYWGQVYYSAGTNRRSLVGALDVLTCRPVESWKTPFLSDAWVRRDVPRAPSGDARIFQQECRTCHAPMDALAGAFAYLDFTNNRLTYSSTVVSKYNQKTETYPEGFQTMDDRWVNLLQLDGARDFGWRSTDYGRGIHSFGKMISESQSFSRCLVKRTVGHFCNRDLGINDPVVVAMSASFESEDRYRLRDLISRVITSDSCR